MKSLRLKLRDYQARTVRKLVKYFADEQSGLLVAPTGAGKTIMIAALYGHTEGRMLVIQHTLDLVTQNAGSMNQYLPGKVVTLAASLPKKASITGDSSKAPIVVGTVSTIVDALPYIGRFDWLVIDEAHRSASASYETIFRALKRRNRALKLFGTTATPERGDRKGIDHLFGDKPAAVIELKTLIGKWLVPPRVLAVPIESLRDIFEDTHGIPAHDRKKFSVSVVHEQVIAQWRKNAQGRKTVMFCADAEHARELSEAFTAAGISSASVDYHDAPGKRMTILEDLRTGGGPDVLCNPLLLTEGFNAPPVSCVGLLRPFASKSLYIQAVGRGLRLSPGKTDCIVLDYVGATHRHGDIVAGLSLTGRDEIAASGVGGIALKHAPLTVALDDEDLEEIDIGIDARETSLATVERMQMDDTPPATRMEAMALGAPYYNTGRPCQKGHVSHRSTATTLCRECVRIRSAMEFKKSQHLRSKRRKDRLSNPAVAAEFKRADKLRREQHRLSNPEVAERERERARRWQANKHARNPDLRAARAAQERERYHSDPEYRERTLNRQRMRRTLNKEPSPQ